MVKGESYLEHVEKFETSLAPYAKKSFEDFSQSFLDGGNMLDYYSKHWQDAGSKLRLEKRTPLQIERDRIVHSSGSRKLTEKYHVLYNGQRRIVRNYITHTMRLVQVTHAISRWLNLNGDFAEAIALGSKIGSLPFIHASKHAVSSWVKNKIKKIDEEFAKNDPEANYRFNQLKLNFGENPLPPWMTNLNSPRIIDKVVKYMPWAAGKDVDKGYSSGQQGYWMLSTNPFAVTSKANTYSPELMYGIWRHSLDSPIGPNTFLHKSDFYGATSGHHEIQWSHLTYEAIVVKYADDITWVVENLNDANSAALLNDRRSIYDSLIRELGGEVPDSLLKGLVAGNTGLIYTYFITDFNKNSENKLSLIREGVQKRIALREGSVDDAQIGLSDEGLNVLRKIKDFLEKTVFAEIRVSNRAKMLNTLSDACMELLYNGVEDILPKYIKEKAVLERWSEDDIANALSLIRDPIHRIQLCVNVFCDMADQEIYDFVGIESL